MNSSDMPSRTPEPTVHQIVHAQRVLLKPRHSSMVQLFDAWATYLHSTRAYREQPSRTAAEFDYVKEHADGAVD